MSRTPMPHGHDAISTPRVDRLVAELVHSGLVDVGVLVEGALSICDLSRRNQVLGVIERGHLRHVVKGHHADVGDRERQVYQALASWPASSSFMPRHSLLEGGGLRVAVVPGTESFVEYRRRAGSTPHCAHLLGAAVASLHRTPHEIVDALGAPSLPGIFALAEPPDMRSWWGTSGADRQLRAALATVPSDPIGAVRRLSAGWRATHLCHGDMKFDNLVVEHDDADVASPVVALRIIDWELAGWGDRTWDLGGIVAQVLAEWVLSMPIEPGRPIAAAAAEAKLDIADGDRWLAQVLVSYGDGRSALSHRDRTHCLRMAGARLLQTAFEWCVGTDRVTASTLAIAQVASNLLDRPIDAGRRLVPRSLGALGV